jgi:Protein of unknown function (DUF3309)
MVDNRLRIIASQAARGCSELSSEPHKAYPTLRRAWHTAFHFEVIDHLSIIARTEASGTPIACSDMQRLPPRLTLHSLEVDMLGTILIIVLILLLIGAFPAWPHSRSWGYAPTGTLGLIVVIIIVLVLLGRI